MTPADLPALIDRMNADLVTLRATGDARRYFHATYLRTTVAVRDAVEKGEFVDGDWVSRWDISFADLYLDALSAGMAQPDVAGAEDAQRRVVGAEAGVSEPWQVAFRLAREQPGLPPLRHVLVGINAHINYDLPQALVAVISSAEFEDPRIRADREEDHRRIDRILNSRVGAEDDELTAMSAVRLLDRILRPLNRAASRRFLAEARAKVWRNAVVLDRARRSGPDAYEAVLAELSRLCAARVSQLTAPGQVLLELGRRGFGVLLPGA